jgi:hypothetical protein
MSDYERPPQSVREVSTEAPRPVLSEDIRNSMRIVDEFIQDAREHHARTGEWPPDPLLDEVAEMRRRVLAEHENDFQKVMEWYVDLGKQHAAQNGTSTNGAKKGGIAGVSGL